MPKLNKHPSVVSNARNFVYRLNTVTGEDLSVWKIIDDDPMLAAVDKILNDEVNRKLKTWTGSKFGPFYQWFYSKVRQGEEVPATRLKRFSMFLGEHSYKPADGVYHLHSFYNNREKEVFWKLVSRGSWVCKEPGRCVKIDLKIVEK